MTEEYRIVRREEIADAALRAFRRKGFQATSMADIIAEAGLSAGAIYGHFKGKSDIVVEVASRVVGDRILDVERLANADPMPSPAEVVGGLMRAMVREVGSTGILVQIWGEAVTDPAIHALVNRVFAALGSAYTSYISLWHQRQHGLAPDDADLLGREQLGLFLAAAQGYIVQSALLTAFDGEAYLANAAKYLPR